MPRETTTAPQKGAMTDPDARCAHCGQRYAMHLAGGLGAYDSAGKRVCDRFVPTQTENKEK